MSSSRWRPAARTTSVGSPASRKRSSDPSAASLLTPGRRRNSPAGAGPAKRSLTCRSARPVIVVDGLDRGEAALPEDADAVAHPLDLRQVVGGEEHGRAVRAELLDEAGELLLHERVQPGGRLVHHDHGRAVHQRLDEPDLLPVPARELPERTAEVGLEAVGERAGERAVVDAAEVGEEIQQLLAGDLLVEGELAGQEARAGAGGDAVAPDVEAEDLRGPGGRAQQAEQRADRGRLAGAVGAEEAEHLAGRDAEGDAPRCRARPCSAWSVRGWRWPATPLDGPLSRRDAHPHSPALPRARTTERHGGQRPMTAGTQRP